MNRKLSIFALVAALLLVFVCGSVALAADDPLKVSMGLETNQFSEPKEITVSISVSNVGESDMPGPVTLYYPSGKQVEEFGSPTLSVGTSKNWSGRWKVTQAELDAGRITFKIKYSIYNDEGELVNKTKNFSKKIIYAGAAPELTVNRTIKPTTAQKDQEVTVTYELENTGTVEITGITIKENSGISSKSGAVEKIAVGEKESYTFTTKMGKKDLTSAATISYKAGGKTYTQKVESATIKYGEVKLSATLTADKKGGAPGETVKLTLKLKNSGTVDFTNVTVTDENLGEVFTGVTVEAGKTETLEKDLTITETQDLQFTVTAEDVTGEPVETATGRVNVIATDPTQQIVLALETTADRSAVYEIPGNVRFTITVRNESAVDVSNIRIRAVDTVINTFDTIPAGESRTFTREMAISMPGIFQFSASCQDQLGQTLTFVSNSLQITLEQPTPEPTEAPIVTPPAPQYQSVPESYEELPASRKLPEWTDQVETIADQAKYILGGITALLFLLLLIGFIRRGIKKSQSNKAMDHLEGANYRDYGTQPKRNRRSVIQSGSDGKEPAVPEQELEENTSQDGELMAETLKRLYNEDGSETAAEEAPAAEEAQGEDPMDATVKAVSETLNASDAARRRRNG
ncbi:MAG: hypothetical protein IJ153_07930 [Clostridia bacterium]|nr:hypothetical protein [Clostridia bacterium]